MANRYWVGGTASWDATAGTKWATTSGGAGGASAPGTSDAVFLDATSGAVTVTLGANASVASVNQTGFTGTLDWAGYEISLALPGGTPWTGATTCTNAGAPRIRITYTGSSNLNVRMGATTEANAVSCVFAGNSGNNTADGNYKNLDFGNCSGANPNNARTVYGNLTLSPLASGSGVNGTTLGATSGTQVITSNGATFDFPVTVNAPGATVQLADALTMGSTRALALTDGGFNANGFNVTAGTVAAGASFDTLTMGAGTWTIQGSGASAWSINAAVTVVPGTSTVSMTSASAKTFAGAGKTYYNLSQGGAGALSITGANTFNDLQNTVAPATITLPASTTTTVSALSLAGTAGNLVTLNSSTPATRATLSKASGTVDASNATIKDIAATGGATWNAFVENNNINAGNNTGWDFGQGPVYDIEFSPALRSFTERKHF